MINVREQRQKQKTDAKHWSEDAIIASDFAVGP